MRTSDDIKELAAALATAQSEMKNAPLNKVNPHFKSKYADLAGIRDATAPVLAKNGLTITQFTTVTEAGLVLTTRLLHNSGQWMEGEYPLPMDLAKPQQMGSALTYARRYSWSAVCGIAAEEDDDGNAAQAGGRSGSEQKKGSPPKQQQEGHPDDLGTTDFKAALRGFEAMRNGLLTSLRGGEISPDDADDRYRKIREGTIHYEVNGKKKSVKTEALLAQCQRSPVWHDDPQDDFPGMKTRLKETREELDRAKANPPQADDDPFAPGPQEEAAE